MNAFNCRLFALLNLRACCCLVCLALAPQTYGGSVGAEAVIRTDLTICQDTSQDDIDVPLDVCSIYLRLTSIDDELLTVFSSDITTTDPMGFFQHPEGNAGYSPECVDIPGDPDLVCDSFVTIGRECAPPFPYGDGTVLDWEFDTIEFQFNGHCVGGWYNSAYDSGQGYPGPDLRVLIAQITVAQGQTVSGIFDAFVVIDGDFLEFANMDFVCTEEPSICNEACVTDVDFDGQTAASDLAVLLGCWGPVTPGTVCECLDDDGNVGPFDLAMLLGHWGACP